MKIRLFIIGILSGVFFMNSCNDDLNPVGETIRPGEDGSNVRADTFQIKTETFPVEGVYARTTTALLGEMYDPLYGTLKADYLCQFYCPDDFEFYAEPIDGKIDSVLLHLRYASWYGDSIAPMVAEVYEVSTDLKRDFYSNFDPSEYYNPEDLWGTQSYTPRDFSKTDSAWNADITNGYYHSVNIKLPAELGQKIYEATLNHPEVFANQDAFNEFFKGVYITTNSNSKGNLLSILETRLHIWYDMEVNTTTTAGNDTSYIAPNLEAFLATKEVIQLNRYENLGPQLNELIEDQEYSYIKSPAGLYTRIIVPTASAGLIDKIEGRTMNSFEFDIKLKPEQDWDDALTPPALLMLLPEDSLEVHFEKKRLIDSSVLSYSANYSSGTRTYTFGNIANMIAAQMREDPEEDLRMVLVPITTVVNSNSVVTDVYPMFTPSAAQIRKDEDLMEFTIISSQFTDKK
ncbi:MAG: DUF4270 domain-containing protein [Tannerellaceae bacterium]|nr:DUF4270 domain-containing protein [Tannerellaceae bacterium]